MSSAMRFTFLAVEPVEARLGRLGGRGWRCPWIGEIDVASLGECKIVEAVERLAAEIGGPDLLRRLDDCDGRRRRLDRQDFPLPVIARALAEPVFSAKVEILPSRPIWTIRSARFSVNRIEPSGSATGPSVPSNPSRTTSTRVSALTTPGDGRGHDLLAVKRSTLLLIVLYAGSPHDIEAFRLQHLTRRLAAMCVVRDGDDLAIARNEAQEAIKLGILDIEIDGKSADRGEFVGATHVDEDHLVGCRQQGIDLGAVQDRNGAGGVCAWTGAAAGVWA